MDKRKRRAAMMEMMMTAKAVVPWLLYDQFITAVAAPMATPHNCEPGPGAWAVVDTSGTGVLTSAGELCITGANGSNKEGVVSNAAIVRVAGLALLGKIFVPADNVPSVTFGWSASKTLPYSGGGPTLRFGNAAVLVGTTTIHSYANGRYYQFALILRSTGAYLVLKVDSNYYMPYVLSGNNTASLYPGVENYHAYLTRLDNIGVIQLSMWGVEPNVYTAKTASPATGASLTTLADSLIELTWTPVANETLSILFRRTDDDNCFKLVCTQADGTIKLYRRQTGADTELNSGKTQTWTAGQAKRIVVTTFGSQIRTFVEDAPKHAVTDTFNQTSTGAIASGFATAANLTSWPYVLTGGGLAAELAKYFQ